MIEKVSAALLILAVRVVLDTRFGWTGLTVVLVVVADTCTLLRHGCTAEEPGCQRRQCLYARLLYWHVGLLILCMRLLAAAEMRVCCGVMCTTLQTWNHPEFYHKCCAILDQPVDLLEETRLRLEALHKTFGKAAPGSGVGGAYDTNATDREEL